jgi:hypothetical protein
MDQIENADENKSQNNTVQVVAGSQIIARIIAFLQLLMCETLAKRLVSMVLIAVDVPNNRVTDLTGLCDRSVRALKKALEADGISSLFHVGGGGRKRKLIDVEESIIEEINNGDYHSQQQIADMILEKHKMKVSLPVISRLLKKMGLKS